MNMQNDNTAVYRKLLELVESGQSGVLVTVVSKSGFGPSVPGSKMLVWSGSRVAGTVGGGAVEFEALEEANKAQGAGDSYLKSYSFNDQGELDNTKELGMVCGGKASLFYEYIPPKENIYIFGAGHIGTALVDHIKRLGFRITVIDSREGYAERLENIQKAIHGDFSTLSNQEDVKAGSYYVLVSHSHDDDFRNLKQIFKADIKPKYIGCIASKVKAKMFLEDLKAEFGDNPKFSVLYSPIGLKTGGKTVEDIAVSILAEIQSIRYGMTGNDHHSIIQKELWDDKPQ